MKTNLKQIPGLLILVLTIILCFSQGCKKENGISATEAAVTDTAAVDNTAGGPILFNVNHSVITSISPISGIANTLVTINGSNFKSVTTDNTVKFHGVVATVQTATTTKLTVLAPATGTTGPLTVTTVDGPSNGITFTYLPTITSISPVQGDIYTLVTIAGAHFKTTTTDNTVKFNGVAATVQTAAANKLTVLAPAAGTTGAVTVTTADGTATGPVFTYKKHVVYVLGSTASGFCYWRNGVRTDLPADASGLNPQVTSIFVSGTDVYVGGSNGDYLPVYWKNAAAGVRFPNNNQTGYVAAIYVSGANVYACGGLYYSPSNSYTLVSWTNTTLNYLLNQQGTPGVAGFIGDMAVSGSDIYITGNMSINSGTKANATYWKNGTPTILTNVTSASANSIFLSGGNIYQTGSISGVAHYFKNGVSTPLTQQPTSGFPPGRTLYVAGTNVYAVAQTNGAAKYWKNDTMYSLTGQDFDASTATCIYGIGNTTYIGGGLDTNNNVWGYWVNGNFVTIPNATHVYDIFVK